MKTGQIYGLEETDFGRLSNFIVSNGQKEIVYELPDFEPMKFLADLEKRAIEIKKELLRIDKVKRREIKNASIKTYSPEIGLHFVDGMPLKDFEHEYEKIKHGLKGFNTLVSFVENELTRYEDGIEMLGTFEKRISMLDYLQRKDCRIKIHYFDSKPFSTQFNDYPKKGYRTVYTDRDLCRKFEAEHAEEFFTAEDFRLSWPFYEKR